MQKTRYQNLAAAIGAFVAAEMALCQARPSLLMLDTEFAPDDHEGLFDMVRFEEHLSGMLSDLVDLCCTPDPYGSYRGPVVLVVADKAEKESAEPAEWQMCAQGYARIEGSN